MSLLRTLIGLVLGDRPHLERQRPKLATAGPVVPLAGPQLAVTRIRPPRPGIIVGQSLEAGYAYKAERGWTRDPKPFVMSTSPQGSWDGGIVLVITDATTLDPDLLRQLRGHRDRLDVVVRP